MYKKTKIVCTIGPSSWDQDVMRKMIDAGMNCVRVNGAFADEAELDRVKSLVKNVSNKVSLMVDVKGPEVRMNKFPNAKEIKAGDEIIIGNDESSEIFPANYKDLYKFVKPGQKVLIGDGDVELVVKAIEGDQMICEVIFGEVLKPGKALNLPGCEYASEVLTEKDKINLKYAIETGWDMVSASFIQDAASAQYVKDFIKENGDEGKMMLIAKIENQAGLDNIDEILKIVDGIMVARGGLDIELGLEKVPMAQRILIKKANQAGKPVITATQMFESMITNPRPTRGEVNDVAAAILLGSDAIMLSAETTTGEYPVEAVRFMSRIAQEIEPHLAYYRKYELSIIEDARSTDALTKAAAEMCKGLDDKISKVIVVSKSGTTARLLGRYQIKQPIYAYVHSEYSMRTLLLSKGIVDVFTQDSVHTDRDEAIKIILDKSLENGIIQKGEQVLLICKTPYNGESYFPNIFEVIKV